MGHRDGPVTRRPSHSRLLHTTQTTRPLTPRNRPLHQAIPRPSPPPHPPRRPRCFDIGVSEPSLVVADGVEAAASGSDVDASLPDGGGGLDAALELHGPELWRIDVGVVYVVGVKHAGAVAFDEHTVDGDRRLPCR